MTKEIPNEVMEVLRMRRRLDKNDTSKDDQLQSLPPMKRVEELSAWFHGDPSWVREMKSWCEANGIYWTTDPNAPSVEPEMLPDENDYT